MSEASATATGYVLTHSGRRFHTLAPRAHEVLLDDVAHALAMKVRFNGMLREFYSIAQHALEVSRRAERAAATRAPARIRAIALVALHHDDAEAYLFDVPSPIKPAFGDLAAIEARLDAAIAEAFALPALAPDEREIIDVIDRAIRDDEVVSFASNEFWRAWTVERTPMSPLTAMSPLLAKRAWLERHVSLRDGTWGGRP